MDIVILTIGRTQPEGTAMHAAESAAPAHGPPQPECTVSGMFMHAYSTSISSGSCTEVIPDRVDVQE